MKKTVELDLIETIMIGRSYMRIDGMFKKRTLLFINDQPYILKPLYDEHTDNTSLFTEFPPHKKMNGRVWSEGGNTPSVYYFTDMADALKKFIKDRKTDLHHKNYDLDITKSAIRKAEKTLKPIDPNYSEAVKQ